MDTIQVISIPLSTQDYKLATEFAMSAPTVEKQEQIYRNTLAVLSGHYYCTMLGIPSQLEKSDCWNAEKRQSQDIADLYVDEIRGQIECRPMSKTDTHCYVPNNVHGNREGYIAIELDEERRAGIIRGFVPALTIEHLPLSYLRPLDEFFERVAKGAQPESIFERLSQWFSGQASLGWLPMAEVPRAVFNIAPLGFEAENDKAISPLSKDVIQKLISDDKSLNQSSFNLERLSEAEMLSEIVLKANKDYVRWQAARLLQQIEPEHQLSAKVNSKKLGLYLSGHTVALMIGLVKLSADDVLIMARVYPTGELLNLPENLILQGSETDGEPFFKVNSGEKDDYIQFLFSGSSGDQFRIEVSLGEDSFAESFRI